MVMSLIESLTKIKNAVYGREVREAIHDGVFRANQIADGAGIKADKTQIRQDAVETQFDAVQRTATETADWGGEIIVASDGEPTLAKRLVRDTTIILNEISHLQSKISVSPDDYEGTDAEKVQQAFDDALGGKKTIALNRMYDLTGSTIYINKLVNTSRISFISTGGGFRKDDAGFMFSSNNNNRNNQFIDFWRVEFKTLKNSGMIIVDGDAIIGLHMTACNFPDIDEIVTASTYMQSLRFINNNCYFGGDVGKYLFDFNQAYDIQISFNQFENGSSGIYRCVSKSATSTFDNNSIRITDNVIEGRRTPTIDFGTVNSFIVARNYFEGNVQDIKHSNLGGHASEPLGLVIDNNHLYKGLLSEDISVDLSGMLSTTQPKSVSFRYNSSNYPIMMKLTSPSVSVDATGSYTSSGAQNVVHGGNVWNLIQRQQGNLTLLTGLSGDTNFSMDAYGNLDLSLNITKSGASDDITGSFVLCTLPEIIRPKRERTQIISGERTAGTIHIVRITIHTNGVVNLTTVGGGVMTVKGTIGYNVNT